MEQIHDVCHVSMLMKYILDPSHVLETPPIELREDRLFKVQLIEILDQREKVLRNKVVPMVKILCVITVSRSTWMTTKIKMESSPIFSVQV